MPAKLRNHAVKFWKKIGFAQYNCCFAQSYAPHAHIQRGTSLNSPHIFLTFVKLIIHTECLGNGYVKKLILCPRSRNVFCIMKYYYYDALLLYQI